MSDADRSRGGKPKDAPSKGPRPTISIRFLPRRGVRSTRGSREGSRQEMELGIAGQGIHPFAMQPEENMFMFLLGRRGEKVNGACEMAWSRIFYLLLGRELWL